MSLHDEVPQIFEPCRKILHHARRMRNIGNVAACRELANRAYIVAQDVGDIETVYHARACVGRLHRYRGEHEDAYMAFRAALMEAEHNQLRRWIGPALHDCFVEAMLSGRDEIAAPYGTARMDMWKEDPEGIYNFAQDIVYIRLQRKESDYRLLYETANQAVWHSKPDPFDRMCMYSSRALAAGRLQHESWFQGSLRCFNAAVDEMGHEEGVAWNLIDVAQGAEALGDRDLAVELGARARHIAGKRRETALQGKIDSFLLRVGVLDLGKLLLSIPASTEPEHMEQALVAQES